MKDGTAPPAGATPHIADGSLVAPDRVAMPAIPANTYGGTPRPAVSNQRIYNTLHVLDFGPGYRPGESSGVTSIEPPRVGAAVYGVLEGEVDVDGNEIAGVRSVFEQVPIGTYLGWNLFRAGRLEGGMCNLQGSFIPFAKTKAEREAIGDSRLSLEERYPTKDVYVAAMRQAANGLVQARLLLPDDATALVGAAERGGIRTGP